MQLWLVGIIKKNGPDRRIKRFLRRDEFIQTKYCKTASKSVAAAFDKDGNYRYGEMKLEVPKDQYEAALKLFEKRIKKRKSKNFIWRSSYGYK